MTRTVRFLILFITITLFVSAASAADFEGQTNVSAVFSEVIFSPDIFVSAIGYTVNGESGVDRLIVSAGDHIEVKLNYLPPGSSLKTTLDMGGLTHELTDYPLRLTIAPHSTAASITVHLELIGYSPTPTPTPTPGPDPTDDPDTPSPSEPVRPDVPDTPGTPDTPGADTPGSDEPGSDKPGSDDPGLDEPGSDGPFVPILPPAGSVYNLAGFIPLGAGALLLFLAFFWKRKVYRILNSHAKKHGEKPEKELLKGIADAIIKLVKDEGRYPEWKKNSDVAKRLSADIVSVLDEMNYPKLVPRRALVAEILKSAKGRINRHRL